jgi:hypothetical protein
MSDELDSAINKVNWHNKDILVMYYVAAFFTLCIMIVEYISYINFTYTQFNLKNFAMVLNYCVIITGASEGVRSFTCSLSQDVGNSTPVPPYKLRYLLGYIASFLVLTITATFLHITVQGLNLADPISGDLIIKPDFAYDSMSHGMLSNIVCYLFARYGDKIAENIDLSNLSIFKRKE